MNTSYDHLIVKARFMLEQLNNEDWLYQTPYGLDYLQGVFTVLNGDYKDTTLQQIIAVRWAPVVQQVLQEAANNRFQRELYEANCRVLNRWIMIGRSYLQALLASAQQFKLLQTYKNALMNETPFCYGDLHDLTCVIMIGKGYYPPYQPGPQVARILHADDFHYMDVMHHHKPVQVYPLPNHQQEETDWWMPDQLPLTKEMLDTQHQLGAYILESPYEQQ